MDRSTPHAIVGIVRSREIRDTAKARLLLTKAKQLLGHDPGSDVSIAVGSNTIYAGTESFAEDWAVLKQIFADGEYANARFAGATVLDLGAHKGYFAAYAFARGAARVTSYEPEPSNFARLSRSAQNSRSWDTRNMAIASRAGSVCLALDSSWTNSLILEHLPGAETLEVSAVTLEQAISEAGDNVTLKMDIEGAERDVLLTTPREALQTAREVLVEVHDWAWSQGEAIGCLREAAFVLAESNGNTLHFVRR